MLLAATSEQVQATLTILKDIAVTILGSVGEVVTVVMDNPLLLIPVGVVMLFTIIKVFRSLFC